MYPQLNPASDVQGAAGDLHAALVSFYDPNCNGSHCCRKNICSAVVGGSRVWRGRPLRAWNGFFGSTYLDVFRLFLVLMFHSGACKREKYGGSSFRYEEESRRFVFCSCDRVRAYRISSMPPSLCPLLYYCSWGGAVFFCCCNRSSRACGSDNPFRGFRFPLRWRTSHSHCRQEPCMVEACSSIYCKLRREWARKWNSVPFLCWVLESHPFLQATHRLLAGGFRSWEREWSSCRAPGGWGCTHEEVSLPALPGEGCRHYGAWWSRLCESPSNDQSSIGGCCKTWRLYCARDCCSNWHDCRWCEHHHWCRQSVICFQGFDLCRCIYKSAVAWPRFAPAHVPCVSAACRNWRWGRDEVARHAFYHLEVRITSLFAFCLLMSSDSVSWWKVVHQDRGHRMGASGCFKH